MKDAASRTATTSSVGCLAIATGRMNVSPFFEASRPAKREDLHSSPKGSFCQTRIAFVASSSS